MAVDSGDMRAAAGELAAEWRNNRRRLEEGSVVRWRGIGCRWRGHFGKRRGVSKTTAK